MRAPQRLYRQDVCRVERPSASDLEGSWAGVTQSQGYRSISGTEKLAGLGNLRVAGNLSPGRIARVDGLGPKNDGVARGYIGRNVLATSNIPCKTEREPHDPG